MKPVTSLDGSDPPAPEQAPQKHCGSHERPSGSSCEQASPMQPNDVQQQQQQQPQKQQEEQEKQEEHMDVDRPKTQDLQLQDFMDLGVPGSAQVPEQQQQEQQRQQLSQEQQQQLQQRQAQLKQQQQQQQQELQQGKLRQDQAQLKQQQQQEQQQEKLRQDHEQQQHQQRASTQPRQPTQCKANGKPPCVCRTSNVRSKKSCLQPRGLLTNSVPARSVVAYVWSAVRHIVPAALLGDRQNRR